MSADQTPTSAASLREALKFFLEDDNYVDRLEAEGLASLINQDGKVSAEERAFLQEAIASANFDGRALETLKRLLEKE